VVLELLIFKRASYKDKTYELDAVLVDAMVLVRLPNSSNLTR
jgi:hypothetical protein